MPQQRQPESKPAKVQSPSQRLATECEDAVAAALLKEGWIVAARNFRHIGCEIDIIAHKDDVLVFVEVKGRKQLPRTASDMIGLLPPRKQLALTRGALAALQRLTLPQCTHYRFDLAIVLPSALNGNAPNIQYGENIFEAVF